jgi:hypothetical protein
VTRPPSAGRRGALAASVLLGIFLAGCGSATSPAAAPAVPAVASSLNTSAVSGSGAWAAVVMGGSAADNNAFWQLFYRPAKGAAWKLVTPPGVATNGGLVLAPGSGASLLAGFRPGVDLTFSPLASTSDGGAHWAAGSSVLAAGLADVPDALAATGRGGMLALAQDGAAEQAQAGAAGWTGLASTRSLAASAAGRRCGLTALTAVSATPAGTPLLAGACARHGIAGIFAGQAGTWRAAAPQLPASLAGQATSVLRLTSTPSGNAALLAAGTGTAASLLAAWTADGGAHWTVSAPLRIGSAQVQSSAFGDGGAITVVLAGGAAETINGPASAWRSLPPVPPGTATLAAGPGRALDALAVHGSKLAIWRLSEAASAWSKTQVITVPIQYGSSG